MNLGGMLAMDVDLNGDNAWPDLKGVNVIFTERPIKVAVLDKGMTSGRPSVCFRISVDIDGDRVVLAQTSARLFCSAAKIIMAKYPDLFEGD